MAVALHFNAIYGSHGYSVIHLEEKKPTEFKPFSQGIPKTREEACKVFRQCFSSYSPAVVKSIFLDYDKMTETPPWLMMMKEVGREVGYYCVHNRTRVSKILTEMLLDGKRDKKYLTGEKVLMIKYFIKRAEIELHLLEKKKIGWQVIDGKSVVFGFIPEKQRLLALIQKLKVTIDEIKHVYIARWEYLELKQELDQIFTEKKIVPVYPSTLDAVKALSVKTGEYLAKIYSGEEYFSDYDCHVAHFLQEKFELQAGSNRISLPVIFKCPPVLVSKKIKINTKIDSFQIVVSNYYSDCSLPPLFVANIPFEEDEKSIIFNFAIDLDDMPHWCVQRNDSKKTVLMMSPNWNELEYIPSLDFDAFERTCFGIFHEYGLEWRLKDCNGLTKIPTAINFGPDDKILIGQAALGNGDCPLLLNFANLLDENDLNYTGPNVVWKCDGKRSKILIKTSQGTKKILPEILFAVFVKSMLKLMEEKMESKIEVIHLFFVNCFQCFEHSQMLKEIEKLFKIKIHSN